ncbi:MAG: hypothetical protein P1V34_11665 [Alphaproteobacteria bacterium]|nr:hypothetical protein [Alphaproteobacteria bacterium]
MIRNFTRIILVFAFLGTLAACRTAPVYNVENDSFTTTAPSLDAAATVIKGAGASLGWQMADQGPGHIVGRLPIRSHLAVVDINFDVEHYSIHYKDSTNLKYDGSTIHSNYNGWIENLQNAITARSSVY